MVDGSYPILYCLLWLFIVCLESSTWCCKTTQENRKKARDRSRSRNKIKIREQKRKKRRWLKKIKEAELARVAEEAEELKKKVRRKKIKSSVEWERNQMIIKHIHFVQVMILHFQSLHYHLCSLHRLLYLHHPFHHHNHHHKNQSCLFQLLAVYSCA